MQYKVILTERAIKELRKMDRYTAALILGWIEKHLEGCENPRLHGSALKSNKVRQWRYRIGNYRIICEIQDDKLTILVLEVGHRRKIYK